MNHVDLRLKYDNEWLCINYKRLYLFFFCVGFEMKWKEKKISS